jgi:fatty acid elongase 2/fatty acid elongase 3
LIGCVTYVIVIFGGRFLMESVYKPLPCKLAFQIHNILLTLVSGVLLALLFEQLFPQLYRHGFYYTICSVDAWTQKHELLYYLNYLVKWWELVDTGFLVIKKKKLGNLFFKGR